MQKFFIFQTGRINFSKYVVMLFLVQYLLGYSHIYAKPMPEPTKDEAFKSQWIVIAEYKGYKSEGKIGYFQGPIAQYQVIRVLKGTNMSKNLNVRYDFQDGSACIVEKEWQFTEDLMPDKGSVWILFLEGNRQDIYFTTYRGDFGRWKANQENIREVEKATRERETN